MGGRPPGGHGFKLMKGAELNQHITHLMQDESLRDTREGCHYANMQTLLHSLRCAGK